MSKYIFIIKLNVIYVHSNIPILTNQLVLLYRSIFTYIKNNEKMIHSFSVKVQIREPKAMSKYQLTINSKDIKTSLNSVQLNNHWMLCVMLGASQG